MTRILVSYYKYVERDIQKTLCFWDGFTQELKNCGNDVYIINTAYFYPKRENNKINKKIDNFILDRIKSFNPEIIITFMHYIPQCILDNFDVPILLFDGDCLDYYTNKSYLKSHIERYNLFSIVKEWKKDYMDFGFKESQYHYLPPATAIQKKDTPQKYNVSFLGNRLQYPQKGIALNKSHLYEGAFNGIVQEFLNTNNFDYENLFFKYFGKNINDYKMEVRDIQPFFDFRWLILANVLDLGLRICGGKQKWDDVAEFMPQITAAFDSKLIWTLEDNIDFYNSSKISLCPMAPQAKNSGFSWRVFDIMASNACLVSSYSSDLKDLTKNYFDIPMYDSPYKVRELCIELLNDEKTRKEIVDKSQKYVDENARWIHRFEEIEKTCNVSLINNAPGQITNIKDDEEFFSGRLYQSTKTPFQLAMKKIYKKFGKYLEKIGII